MTIYQVLLISGTNASFVPGTKAMMINKTEKFSALMQLTF